MKFYINDIPIFLQPLTMDAPPEDARTMIGKVSLTINDQAQLNNLLANVQDGNLPKLEELTCLVGNLDDSWNGIQEFFELVEAAGGLVRKDGQFLLIHRLGKWDLPKGKLEKGESPEEGALREVEEECQVEVTLDTKICDTWHTYIRNDKRYLKKTYWYSMDLVNDQHMTPQTEEDIERVEWMDQTQLQDALKDTYPSIRDVFEAYGV